jgi:hypothetical protein
MNIVVGTSNYGVHLTTYRWGFALHWEWRGKTYGGSWAL